MKPLTGVPTKPALPPAILVVDDDRRVVELLQIALTAHGFRVLTAADGEEALRRCTTERPDLVVLDVRLPKKSGLEVCEALRQDPDDPHVPIVMVSAVAETEARLQGLARGADDYLTKPFSPKELIARIKRLLARSADARDSRDRRRVAEHELAHTREEMQRVYRDLRREQQLRDLTLSLGRDLHRTLDPDELARRILVTAHAQLGVESVALLRREGDWRLVPAGVHGDGFQRIDGFTVPIAGELLSVLAGLGRPARREELERLSELRGEVAPFVARGFMLLAPLCGPDGLEALLLADERPDGRGAEALELDGLATLCDLGATALCNARRAWAQAEGLIAELAGRVRAASSETANEGGREARVLLAAASAELGLLPRERSLVVAAMELGTWAQSDIGRASLAAVATNDPTGMLAELGALCASDANAVLEPTPERRRSQVLVAAGHRYQAAREQGAARDEALAAARGPEGTDTGVGDALLRAAGGLRPLATTR